MKFEFLYNPNLLLFKTYQISIKVTLLDRKWKVDENNTVHILNQTVWWGRNEHFEIRCPIFKIATLLIIIKKTTVRNRL